LCTHSFAVSFRATPRHGSDSGSVCPSSGRGTTLIMPRSWAAVPVSIVMSVGCRNRRHPSRETAADRDVYPVKSRHVVVIQAPSVPPGKRVYVKSVTRVRIPPHPLPLLDVDALGGAFHSQPDTRREALGMEADRVVLVEAAGATVSCDVPLPDTTVWGAWPLNPRLRPWTRRRPDSCRIIPPS
jgi:hypothetical protein